MHHTTSLLFWLLYFVIAVLVGWITLSLILTWTKPVLYNSDGTVNWVTTLWIATLVILFAWLVRLLLHWLIQWFMRRCDPCAEVGYDSWMI